MNIVPKYLADVFYLSCSESNKKPYKPQVVKEGRAITYHKQRTPGIV